ncbi:MAG: hypothetical protein F6K47_29665 [Symploca sp. SIO2E6]|nr:hypothetical protein [Symploca sp. SIO2E6]
MGKSLLSSPGGENFFIRTDLQPPASCLLPPAFCLGASSTILGDKISKT